MHPLPTGLAVSGPWQFHWQFHSFKKILKKKIKKNFQKKKKLKKILYYSSQAASGYLRNILSEFSYKKNSQQVLTSADYSLTN